MGSENFKILLVDDEPDILEIISYTLKSDGYLVYTAENGVKAIELAKKVKPDLIILDVMMPEMDGIEACEIIRNDSEIGNSLIVFLSARGEDYSQIAGFNAGADDYITKPIKPKKVSLSGKDISLPRKEFELLFLLCSKPGKVFKREFILESVWGKDVVVGDRTIDVHIRKLREKIGDSCFKTVKGVGYKFQN